jgi:hypothetical protein
MKRHSVLQGHWLVMILVISVCNAFEGLSWLPTVNAFSSAHHHHESCHQQSHPHQRKHGTKPRLSPRLQHQKGVKHSQTALALGDDWWNSLRGIFENLTNGDGHNSGDDDMAAGTSVIASIPGMFMQTYDHANHGICSHVLYLTSNA